ncbi:MAG: hypothetical protein WCJ94_01530 [bacterium]
MKNKTMILIYLLCMAGITVTAFIMSPFSFTSIFMAVAFVINLLLFMDTFTKE